jgi:hypothetical protein
MHDRSFALIAELIKSMMGNFKILSEYSFSYSLDGMGHSNVTITDLGNGELRMDINDDGKESSDILSYEEYYSNSLEYLNQ